MRQPVLFVAATLLLTGPATISTQETESQVGMTAAHNRVRTNINSGLPPTTGEPVQPLPDMPLAPMMWADDLAAGSQAYLNTCTAGHDPNRPARQGENIASRVSSVALSPVDPWFAVHGWAGEASKYDHATNVSTGGFAATGHYTQLVWNTTVEVGCGFVDQNECPNMFPGFPFQQRYLCRYRPGGNVRVSTTRPYCSPGMATGCQIRAP